MVFTKENQLVIIFIIFAAIVGSGVALVKHFRPGLFMGKPDYVESNDSKEHKDKTLTEIGRNTDLATNLETIKTTKEPVKSGAAIPSGSEEELIDLNTATVEQLQQLPRIGPVMARRIVEYRKLHRRFTCIEQIMEVRGIGEKTFAKLKDKIVVRQRGGKSSN